MTVQTVNEASFEASVRRQGTALVEFGAVWCPPCNALLPILGELSEEYGDRLPVVKVDCDESPELASRYGVMSMPTVIVFHNGEPVDKLVGFRPKDAYKALLARYT